MNAFTALLAFVAFVVATASGQKIKAITDEAAADRITTLPGYTGSASPGFSGYLHINGSASGTTSKHMHYWLVESLSEDAVAIDTVSFWTNGGPGCSGLLGALTELGPFRPTADGKLVDNPYSWTKYSNFVFIEQPCGVGYSYSDDPDNDYKTDDATSSNDFYATIQAFLVRFPQFSKSKVFLTSESYGGHYTATTAKVIVDKNTEGKNPQINFGGFAVGNPDITSESTTPSMIQTWWGHQLLSQPLWENYLSTCVESKKPNVQECEDLFLDMYMKTKSLNPYALDYPVCLADPSPFVAGRYGRMQRLALLRNQLQHLSPKTKAAMLLDDEYVPCEDDYMTTWLNSDNVKTALHVKSDLEWVECSRSIHYNQLDGTKSMVPYYQYLLDGNDKYNIDILVYSGDDDSVCGTVGTQGWIYGVGGEAKTGADWATWTVPKDAGNSEAGQTGGYLVRFKNKRFAFATVHGAGHEVPTYKPAAALFLFKSYITGAWTKNN